MRVLLYSGHFFPKVHGEVVFTHLLAKGLHENGIEVVLATSQQDAKVQSDGGYRLVPVGSDAEYRALLRDADLVHLQSFPRKRALQSILSRKAIVVTHHAELNGDLKWRKLGPRLAAYPQRVWPMRAAWAFARRVAVSEFVRSRFDPASVVVHNPYDDTVFDDRGEQHRSGILFSGRRNWTKGYWQFLRAAAAVLEQRPETRISVAGPAELSEVEKLSGWVRDFGLEGRVSDLGVLDSRKLAATLNAHEVFAFPSLVHEAFGIAGLEALACGCRVVASGRGGMREALGPWADYADPDDAEAMASALLHALDGGSLSDEERAGRRLHLAQFNYRLVARNYEAVYRRALGISQ